jgi:hypothetical protein
MVEYSGPLLITCPIEATRGNHRLLFEINNRGAILSFGLFNDAVKNSNDPSTAADAGNGFMMRQGYTLVGGAWDAVSGTRADVLGGPFVLDTPVARNLDGSRHRRAQPRGVRHRRTATKYWPVSSSQSVETLFK